ncbi:hypothetical protein D3C85_1769160 [compost metagenome]
MKDTPSTSFRYTAQPPVSRLISRMNRPAAPKRYIGLPAYLDRKFTTIRSRITLTMRPRPYFETPFCRG